MVPTQDLHKASLAHSGLIFFFPFFNKDIAALALSSK